jgi:hypothetical protein
MTCRKAVGKNLLFIELLFTEDGTLTSTSEINLNDKNFQI